MEMKDMWEPELSKPRFDPNYIKAWLYNERCRVTFTKKDGTIRTMLCTLKEKYLPPHPAIEETYSLSKALSASNHIVTVWDLEKKDWRSFKYDSVLEFTPLDTPSEDFDA